MADTNIKKSLLEQLNGMLRKGELNAAEHKTLITKVELSDERLLKMALAKFATLRKSASDAPAAESDPKETK